ncbi:unnamed protein product [Thelazia callipaeda]|uniref:RING-type domain-containing protein n=1 Tax=Thelazia callipaeda TaxID=103827 RepID=A0A0N5DA21_THECL|nr:unnamed protein product [Thelazia callipaeda]
MHSAYLNAAHIDEDQSIVMGSGSKSNSTGRKKGDKKERPSDKMAVKRTEPANSNEVEHLAKTDDTDKQTPSVVASKHAITPEPKYGSVKVAQPTERKIVRTASPVVKVQQSAGGAKAFAYRTTKTTRAQEEGIEEDEQYLSAEEGRNVDFSDNSTAKVRQYRAHEQSRPSGSKDLVRDGASYRFDNGNDKVPPVTSEETGFIQVTAKSKRRGGGNGVVSTGAGVGFAHHQQGVNVTGIDRRSTYTTSTAERGGKNHGRRENGDRMRRSSVQFPSEKQKNLPLSRGIRSPSPVDHKSSNMDGKNQGGQWLVQQTQVKATATLGGGRKGKYGGASHQASRTTSPDRRTSQLQNPKYSTAAIATASGSIIVAASSPEAASDSERKRDSVNGKSSWADIAKKRLGNENVESRPKDTFAHHSLNVRVTSADGHSLVCGHTEKAQEMEQNEKQQVVSNADSFAEVVSCSVEAEAQREAEAVVEAESGVEVEAKVDAGNSSGAIFKVSGIVLKLDSGKQVVLPENDLTNKSSSIVNCNERPEIAVMQKFWKYFVDTSTGAPLNYREYKRRKEERKQEEESESQLRSSTDQQKGVQKAKEGNKRKDTKNKQ